MAKARTLAELRQLVELALLVERLNSAQAAIATYGWAEPALSVVGQCVDIVDGCTFPSPESRKDFEHFFSTVRLFHEEGGPPPSMSPNEIVDLFRRVQASALKAVALLAPERLKDQRNALLMLLEARGEAARPLPRAEAAVYLHSGNTPNWREMIDKSGLFVRDNRDNHKLRLTAEGREEAEALVDQEAVESIDEGTPHQTARGHEVPGTPDERWPLPPYDLKKQPWFPQPQALRDTKRKDAEKLRSRVQVVVLVATPAERAAVLHAMKPCKGRRKVTKAHVENETYYVGLLGAHHVAVLMCQMGTSAKPGSSAYAVPEALAFWQPVAVIAVGIAFGRDPRKQAIADVLVSDQVCAYELQRVGEGQPVARGPRQSAGQALLNRFSNVTGWRFVRPDNHEVAIRVGELLSGEKLVDNLALHAALFEMFPNAIGGEMEATGVMNAAHRAHVEWIIVKAICDWGYGKGKAHQALASAAAVSLVEHVLSSPSALSGLSNDEIASAKTVTPRRMSDSATAAAKSPRVFALDADDAMEPDNEEPPSTVDEVVKRFTQREGERSIAAQSRADDAKRTIQDFDAELEALMRVLEAAVLKAGKTVGPVRITEQTTSSINAIFRRINLHVRADRGPYEDKQRIVSIFSKLGNLPSKTVELSHREFELQVVGPGLLWDGEMSNEAVASWALSEMLSHAFTGSE